MIENSKKAIAVIGLGYVGLPLLVEFAKHYQVLGFDINEERIKSLRKGEDKTKEISREDVQRSSNIVFTSDKSLLGGFDFYIITVPTPVSSANQPDLTALKSATNTVAEYISRGSTIIYESTVYPGCTEEICIPILEKVSGLIINKDFHVGYSPERIVPGDKVHTLTKIKKIVSGSSEKALGLINNLYQNIIEAGTYPVSSIKVAEAAKVIENTQRDLNIALANELSLIFSRMNIDTSEVIEAAASKWNFHLYRPGFVGGHCIGVDPYYLTHKAEILGYIPQIILAGRRINESMAGYAARKVLQMISASGNNLLNKRIGVLGLTFKENCPDIRNSKIFDMISELKAWGADVLIHDPVVDPSEIWTSHSIKLSSLLELHELDGLIIAVGHNEYRELTEKQITAMCRPGAVVADLKSILRKDMVLNLGFKLFRL